MSLVGFKAQNHPQQQPKDTVDDRAIKMADFLPLHERFRFTIDAAASPTNARLPRFWTLEDDALSQSWAGERVWCNPPYSDIAPWVNKAWAEAEHAEVIVMLLPANRTEQVWWQEMVEPYRDRPGSPLRTEFFRGRLRFIAHDATEVGMNERPPFGCCLLIWNEAAVRRDRQSQRLPSLQAHLAKHGYAITPLEEET